MKHNFKLLALLAIGLCGMQTVFGQNNAAASKELRDLQIKAQNLRAVRSSRTKTTTEVFDEKGTTLKYKYESVSESVPPDSRRFTSTAVIDGKSKKTEIIQIGEKTFIKIDDGKWKLDEPEERYGIAVGVLLSVRLLEETTLNGQPVKIYEEKGSSSSDAGNRGWTRKYWFTAEGELLKTESEETHGKTNEIARSVTVFEYDADIKIEAPIKP
jgi:hypothetical protein